MSKVLVIDDDPTIVSIYCNKFEALGFAVEGAPTGEEGLLALKRFKPDVVLLDLDLPQASGVDVLQQIRSESDSEKLPVVAFSAGTVAGQVIAAWDAMATCVLMKGRDQPARVLDVVKSVIGCPRQSIHA